MTDATDPLSDFEWWSGLGIPLITGVGSLVLAAAALVISLIALADARTAMKLSQRSERANLAERLTRLMDDVAVAIDKGDFETAWTRARDEQAAFALSRREGPRSIAGQLLYWAMYAKQYSPDNALRLEIASEIMMNESQAIAEWADDDEGKWKHTRRSIDDITVPAPTEPDHK